MPRRKAARREADRRRHQAKPWRKWYATKAWKQRRARQLHDHPWCAKCLQKGMTRKATAVDHVERHNGDRWKFFHGRVQSLCDPCHNAPKQREERAGFADDLDDDGWPTDPAHPFNAKRDSRPSGRAKGRLPDRS